LRYFIRIERRRQPAPQIEKRPQFLDPLIEQMIRRPRRIVRLRDGRLVES
jgi:hypothetical protein